MIASLRCGDPDRLRAIAAGGGPTRRGDDLHVWCVLCGCSMSQDVHEPNPKCEWCEHPECWCHDDPEQGDNQ